MSTPCHCNGTCQTCKKGHTAKSATKPANRSRKFRTVMREFRDGKLLSSGHPVTDRKQAIAIAYAEARAARKAVTVHNNTGHNGQQDQADELTEKDTATRKHIVKEPNGKYRLLSHDGKNLGTFDSHAAAAKHEGQVEYFKTHKSAGAAPAAAPQSSVNQSLGGALRGFPATGKPTTLRRNKTRLSQKAQHGGRGGGMVPDKFQTDNPMPVGSKVVARKPMWVGYEPGVSEGVYVGTKDRLEVVGHEGSHVVVRTPGGREVKLPRIDLRGKTTGRGHPTPPTEKPAEKPKVPANESRHDDDSAEKPAHAGTCKPGQTVAETGCTAASLTQGGLTRKSSSAPARPHHPCSACCDCPRCRSAVCLVTYRAPALTLKDGRAALPDRTALMRPNKQGDVTTDDARMTASGILASSNRDRQGDIIECRGVLFEDHKANPIVLWDHGKRWDLPIGKTEDGEGRYTVKYLPQEDIIVQTTHFADTPFSRQIYALIKGGFVRANSIAVKDLEVEKLPPDPARGHFVRRDQDGRPIPFKHILRSALAEVTWTPLPANPDAVMSLMSTGKLVVDGFDAQPLDALIYKSFLPYVPTPKVWTNGLTLKSGTPRRFARPKSQTSNCPH